MGTQVRRKVLIDGDWIVYAAGFAGQKTEYVQHYAGQSFFGPFGTMTDLKNHAGKDFDPGKVYSRIALDPPEHVYHSAKMMLFSAIKKIQERYPQYPLDVHVFLDGDGNYRHKIASIRPYKGTRVAPRPVMYHELRAYLITQHGARQVFDQETDDALSIMAHAEFTRSEYGSYPIPVVVGVDKDFLQIPGIHYNPNKGFCYITRELGETLVYRQCLTGDTVDNIMGCPGIGPVKAKALIRPDMLDDEKWEYVIHAYEGAYEKDPDVFRGLTGEEAAIENMQLVWLRTKPGELWAPPSRKREDKAA